MGFYEFGVDLLFEVFIVELGNWLLKFKMKIKEWGIGNGKWGLSV